MTSAVLAADLSPDQISYLYIRDDAYSYPYSSSSASFSLTSSRALFPNPLRSRSSASLKENKSLIVWISLLIRALVVRALKLRSSIEVINSAGSSPSESPGPPGWADNGAATSTRVWPARAVYWLTKIAAASSKASRGGNEPSVSMRSEEHT